MCTVVNKHKQDFDVDIQRGTKFGNPHRACDTNLADALNSYRVHLKQEIRSGRITKQELIELHGKRLGCTCHPKPCHGDILAELVNKLCGTYRGLDI